MKDKSYQRPVLLAIALHVLLAIAVLWHYVPEMRLGAGEQTQIIQASVINTKILGHASHTPTPVQKIVKPVEQKPIEKPVVQPPKPVQPELTKPDTEQLQKQLAAKQAEEKQQAEKQAALQQAAAHEAAEKAQAALKKQQEKAEKLKQQQLAAKQKAAKEKQLAKQIQADQQKLMQQQIAQEQQQLSQAAASAARDKAWQSEIDKYKALIVASIGQNWIVPDNTDKNLSCQLLIQVGPGGAVLNVQVAQSSGNDALDSSAVNAVYKAAPLPVPSDPQIFDKFRQLRLTVRPENLVAQ